jgi:hypothetical protein
MESYTYYKPRELSLLDGLPTAIWVQAPFVPDKHRRPPSRLPVGYALSPRVSRQWGKLTAHLSLISRLIIHRAKPPFPHKPSLNGALQFYVKQRSSDDKALNGLTLHLCARSYALAWAVFTAVLVAVKKHYTVSIDLDRMSSLSLEYK